MWVAIALFVVAALSSSLNTVLVARDHQLERLPFLRRTTARWGVGHWLTYAIILGCALLAMIVMSHHAGYPLAILVEAAVVLGPVILITAAHNHHQGARRR